jgi:hypothetical protein
MKPYGVRIFSVVKCDSGFGEWESRGPQFVRKNSISPRPDLDGLIRNQTGPAVQGETVQGETVIGMLTRK